MGPEYNVILIIILSQVDQLGHCMQMSLIIKIPLGLHVFAFSSYYQDFGLKSRIFKRVISEIRQNQKLKRFWGCFWSKKQNFDHFWTFWTFWTCSKKREKPQFHEFQKKIPRFACSKKQNFQCFGRAHFWKNLDILDFLGG